MDYQQPPQQPPQSSVDQQPQQPGQNLGPKTSMGLDPNVAAALSYLCGWFTGLVFFLSEKDNDFVRFHALQSIITFGILTVGFVFFFVLGLLIPLLPWLAEIGLCFVWFICLVLLAIKAFQGERFHFPIIGDIAEKYVNKVG